MFRLNYGNGQVSSRFKTRKEAELALSLQLEFDLKCGAPGPAPVIQRYVGDGEWTRLAERKGQHD